LTSDVNPLRILLSEPTRRQLKDEIAAALGGAAHLFVEPGDDADLAFVSRDITGLSTKHKVLPETKRYYEAMLKAPSLRWTHAHSAGADRPIYTALRERGVQVTTSTGANAPVVVQTALAGILALARRFPQLMQAQRKRVWAPLIGSGLPRDLEGQTALIVGWGPIGQGLGRMLQTLGLRIAVVRSSAAPVAPDVRSAAFEDIGTLLPQADWLVLACPLTERTRGLIDAAALALLPRGAHVVNVARGEVVVESALTEALSSGALAGAYLDVFEQEPLPAASPLWSADNVIATPHSAGQSDANERRVAAIFLDNLGRWRNGLELLNRVA
jgi:phosphoglycerate dehydrogenase-like enzyme